MGLIDNLRRVGGIVKNRLASAVGAIRTQARAISVRVPRSLRLTARAARLTSPLGIGITAATFAPSIVRFVRRGLTPARQAVTRGIAFVGGQRVVTAAGAGGIVGALSSRKSGSPTRPSEVASVPTRRKPVKRRPTARRKPVKRRKKRIPAHRHRVVSVPVRRKKRKKATHRSPRHRGHKRVSFTTADGKKVSFLANPKARHR